MNLDPNTLILALAHQAQLAQQASELPKAYQMIQEAQKQVEQLKAELAKEREDRAADSTRYLEQLNKANDRLVQLMQTIHELTNQPPAAIDVPEVLG